MGPIPGAVKKPPSALDKAIGSRIRSYRVTKGMSQTDLGNHLDLTFQQIQKYEKGVNRVSGSRITMIAQALGISISDLFGNTATPEARAVDELFRGMDTTTAARLLDAYQRMPPRVASVFVRLAETVAEVIADGKE